MTDARVGRAAARLAKHVEIGLAHADLSPAQYRVLVLLNEGSIAASALASGLVVSPPSVTALVDGLVSRGLVERTADAGDRRRVVHVLTQAGRDMLHKGDAVLQERLEAVAACLPPADRDKALAALDRWHDAMDIYLAKKLESS